MSSSTHDETCRTVLIDHHGSAFEDDVNKACGTETENVTISNATAPPIYLEEEEIHSPNSLLFTDEENISDEDEDFSLGSDMGLLQSLDADHRDEIYQRIRDARRYLQEVVMTENKYEKVRGTCQNAHADCTYWAILGECDNNPGYMTVHCAPACQSCDKLHVDLRCPMDSTMPNALERPGDLNAMFERILSEYQDEYGITVLSRPDYAPGDGPDTANITYYVGGIWILQMDKVLTDHEADRLIELGAAEGYERSSDVGEELEDGTHEKNVNDGRTSTNAWCLNDCLTDPITERVLHRIENITGIPQPNYENLQLLRYEESQFYNVHNDFIDYQVDRPCGSRILTFYMYLNDVEHGGGTNFPAFDLTVAPKKGRAVLWPSVLDSDPFTRDLRSNHQALPVLKGSIKYGANAWIHQRDFQAANHIGCA